MMDDDEMMNDDGGAWPPKGGCFGPAGGGLAVPPPLVLTPEDYLALARAPRLAGPAVGDATRGDLISQGAGHDSLMGGGGEDPIILAGGPGAGSPYVRGPDGKLHAAPGRTVTGPFEFGRWAHNVDWGGVARDLASIGAGVAAWGGTAPALAASLAGMGDATTRELWPPQRPKHW